MWIERVQIEVTRYSHRPKHGRQATLADMLARMQVWGAGSVHLKMSLCRQLSRSCMLACGQLACLLGVSFQAPYALYHHNLYPNSNWRRLCVESHSADTKARLAALLRNNWGASPRVAAGGSVDGPATGSNMSLVACIRILTGVLHFPVDGQAHEQVS
ncbi:hypothetical protein BDV96DRAFT_74871 [Lophiotrema nucula]|uniref:Uncharacterized protein n=1 Tax=Lophiotrema nucula TaxID=690887 RepID=A0A6A5Z7C3_9PLEO|nr:hypothetical protein BDV96DRAFT_74871 [Lophiotrema nucula]